MDKHSKDIEELSPLLPVGGDEFPRYAAPKSKRCGLFYKHVLAFLAFLALGYHLKTRAIPFLQNEIHIFQDNRDIPHYGVLGTCANWTISGQTASAEFKVDLHSALEFKSSGVASGNITFIQSTVRSPNNEAKITVNTVFDDPKFLDYIKVCQLGHKEFDPWSSLLPDATPRRIIFDGLAVLTVPYRPRQSGLFSIVVELPLTEPPLHLELLTTYMNSFTHRFDDLGETEIDAVMVSGTNSPIVAEPLSAKRIRISTSNAPIRGTYKAADALWLMTDNSFIDVEMHLNSRNVTESAFSNRVRSVAVTSNGYIQARYNLTHAEESGGEFDLYAETTRGKVDIGFIDAPVKSSLWIDARTKFDRVDVSLHPTYEGRFSMNALLPYREIVDTRSDENYPKDPSGQDQQRVLWEYYKGLFSHKGGLIWGGRGAKDRGDVKLQAVGGSTRVVF